jgi:hypothetical protein
MKMQAVAVILLLIVVVAPVSSQAESKKLMLLTKSMQEIMNCKHFIHEDVLPTGSSYEDLSISYYQKAIKDIRRIIELSKIEEPELFNWTSRLMNEDILVGTILGKAEVLEAKLKNRRTELGKIHRPNWNEVSRIMWMELNCNTSLLNVLGE